MASFDAGSIDGRLDLDTDPFVRGMEMAEARADAFEAKPIVKKVILDDKKARAQMDAFDAEEDAREIRQRVNVETAAAERQMDAFRARERMKNAAAARSGGGFGMGGMLMPALIGGALGPLPALAPTIPGLLGPSAAAASGFGQLMIFGLLEKSLATSAIKSADAAVKAKKATEAQREIVKNVKDISDQWDRLATSPAMVKMLGAGSGVLSRFIPKLQPLVNSISGGLMPVISELDKGLNSANYGRFQRMLQGNAKNLLPVWGDTTIKTLSGIGGTMVALNPELIRFSNTLNGMADRFAHWGQDGGARAFLNRTEAYASQFRPETRALRSNVVDGLENLLGPHGLANPQLVHGALGMLNGLFSTLAHANMKPLVGAISGIQQLESSVGGGIGKALPGFLSMVGSVTHLASELDWRLVGSTLGMLFKGIGKLADGVEKLNEATGGFVGEVATLAGMGFVGKKVVGGVLSKLFERGSPGNPMFVVSEGSLGGGGGGILDFLKGKKGKAGAIGAVEAEAEAVAGGGALSRLFPKAAGFLTKATPALEMLGSVGSKLIPIAGWALTAYSAFKFMDSHFGPPTQHGTGRPTAQQAGLTGPTVIPPKYRGGAAVDLTPGATVDHGQNYYLYNANGQPVMRNGQPVAAGSMPRGWRPPAGQHIQLGLPGQFNTQGWVDPNRVDWMGGTHTVRGPRGNMQVSNGSEFSSMFGGVSPGSAVATQQQWRMLQQLATLSKVQGFALPGLQSHDGFLSYSGKGADLTKAITRLNRVLDVNGQLDPKKIQAVAKWDKQHELDSQLAKMLKIASMFPGMPGGPKLPTGGTKDHPLVGAYDSKGNWVPTPDYGHMKLPPGITPQTAALMGPGLLSLIPKGGVPKAPFTGKDGSLDVTALNKAIGQSNENLTKRMVQDHSEFAPLFKTTSDNSTKTATTVADHKAEAHVDAQAVQDAITNLGQLLSGLPAGIAGAIPKPPTTADITQALRAAGLVPASG